MKITSYHIELYNKVGGDVDHLQRIGTSEEKTEENQYIICMIAGLVSDWILIKNNLASKDYAKNVELKIKKLCIDESVIIQLKSLKLFG